MIRNLNSRFGKWIDNVVLATAAKAPVRIGLALFLLGLFGGGALFAITEGASFFDSVYWSVVVMTTVGFGDLSPASEFGHQVFYFTIACGKLSELLLIGALAGAITKARVEHNDWEDTPELDDDIAALIQFEQQHIEQRQEFLVRLERLQENHNTQKVGNA